MIYPSIDKLLKIVKSKYSLALVAADRSKEMTREENYQLAEGVYKSKKNIGKALEEIEKGMIIVNE